MSPKGIPVRLLLVEDSENDAMLLLRELRRGGYEPVYERVYTPEGMRRALEEAGGRGEFYEVVVSDYYMPRFRAPDALELLRGLGYDVPFIVVSGKIGEDAAVGIMKAGANDYLTKENMARLCPAIERELKEAAAREEAERKAREAEVRYQTLVEQIPAITYVQDPSGEKPVRYVSPQVEKVLGYPADREMLDPDHWLEIMHPDDRARVVAEDEKTDRTGEPFKVEYRQFAADGRMVWIRDEAVLVRDDAGNPLYWQGVQYDITDRKLAEEELRRSEERYRTFIEQSSEGIWRFELETPMPTDISDKEQLDHLYRHAYLAECNDVMARMYGFDGAQDLVGARIDVLLPRSKPENVAFLREALRGGYRLTDGESREFDRDGNEKVFVNNVTGIVEDGRVVRIWGTQRDVTEQKEAEDLLARLASFPELNPNPIVETTLEGVPTYLNPAAQARFPDLRKLGAHHPVLADLGGVNRSIWSAGGRPFVREVEVGDNFYQQAISRTPEGGLLRIYGIDVTERRRAEDALRESEERFRSLVQNTSDIIVVLDETGTIVYESPAVERVLGFTPEERIGTSALDLIHPEDRGRVAQTLRERRDTPGPFPPVEYRVMDKEGSWHRLEAVGENLLDDPAVGGVVISSRDVTERAQAEEGLRRTLKELADLKFAIDESAIVAFTDQRGRISYVNDKFCEISGYSRDELIGEDHRLINSGFHPKEYIRVLWKTIAQGRVWRGELRNRAKNGSIYWVDTTIVPFLDERGKPYQYVAIRHDVTARKEAEGALRESRENLQAILDNSTAVIYVKDREGRYSLVNRSFEELFGLRKEEVIGRTDHDFFAREAADEYRRNDLEVLRAGAPVEAEEEARHADGVVHTYFSTKFPLKGADGEPYATCGISTDITSRKKAERELRASEERFRATFDQAAVGITQVGLDGRWLRVNRRLCEIVGYDEDELLGLTFQQITHPEDLDKDLEYLERLISGEIQTFSMEKRYLRKDDSTVWVNLTVSLVREPSDGSEYLVGVVEDITERRRAEDALREAEGRYRTLVEELPAVTYVQDAETNTLTYLSPQIEGVLGYTPGEYLADPTLRPATIHPDDLEWVLAEDERTDKTGEPYAVEHRRIARDGSVVWVRDEAVLVRDDVGDPRYWQGFLTDITGRRRAEERLRQSEELYRNVVEQAAESIFLLDVETLRVLEANAALGETLGYRPEELKGMSFYAISAHDRESIDRNVERVVREERLSLGVRQYRRRDGGLVDVEVSISTVPYDGGTAMCVVAHDVTDRLRAERDLVEIREAERNRIARELHDGTLQDIVYAIQELQILEVTGRGGEEGALEDTAEALRRSVEGLRAAIFDLRLKETLGRSLAASLENLVDLNRRMARGAYDLELVVGEDVPDGMPEERGREIVRIVQEALTNVRRHSGAGHARVKLGVEGDNLYVEVSDDGRGFDPDVSAAGMGRHSMGQRALELGGEVDIRSKPGAGTRVTCRVPLARTTGGIEPQGRDF